MARLLRVSAVASFFKSPDFIEYVEAVPKRDRTNQRKRAFKVGSRVDELIKTGKTPVKSDSEEVHAAFESFLEWKRNYNPKIEPATRMDNLEIGITGEPDLYINGDELNDIKCATEIRLENWIQLGGYLLLPLPKEIKRVSILRLDKKSGNYEYRTRTDLEVLKVLFKGEVNKLRAYEQEVGDGATEGCYHAGVAGDLASEVGGQQ